MLGLLLEEFPDITISKIRFLESQGLIAPERTPSGYRKFYEPDVELLKVILREQRENYLPLRVIKDRIDSGAIDPSGEMTKPEDLADMHAREDIPSDDVHADRHEYESSRAESNQRGESNHGGESDHGGREHEPDAEVPAGDDRRPSGVEPIVPQHAVVIRGRADAEPARAANGRPDRRSTTSPQLLPGVLLEAAELCAMTSITGAELQRAAELRHRHRPRERRHDALRRRRSRDRQGRRRVPPRRRRRPTPPRAGARPPSGKRRSSSSSSRRRLRQRNPESRTEALNQLRQLDALGAKLRAALMRTALRHHFEG